MMEPPPPPGDDRRGMVRWTIDVVRQLTVQNVLTAALLVAIAIPSFFAYRFLTDQDFRREFTTNSEIVNAGVPCIVVTGNLEGRTNRTTVATTYALRDRMEYLIAIVAPTTLQPAEIAETCKLAHDEANRLKEPAQ